MDYDRLDDLAEHHTLIRAAMGLGDWQQGYHFDWTRIWRNVRTVRAETLVLINLRIVQLGHTLAPNAAQSARVDSFVMQTNIHHPSDLRQVTDGLRVVLRHATRLAEVIGNTALRQHAHLEKRARILALTASRAAASKHRDRDSRLAQAARELCDFADARCQQAMDLRDSFLNLREKLPSITQAQAGSEQERMMCFVGLLATCAQVARVRLVEGETVEFSERLCRVFEPHTEFIYRGKVRAAVEFGHRVLVTEDAAGFILSASAVVMPNGQQDRDAAVLLVKALCAQHPNLTRVSFDRGFHSPANQTELADILPDVCLPNSGGKALAAQTATASVSWTWQRRHHSGSEAAIGNLQDNRGCRRCLDKGKDGYDRFLQTAVLANNLITYGRLLWAQDDPHALPARTRRKSA